jgi:O-antigen/teichoic acid export membrane protein
MNAVNLGAGRLATTRRLRHRLYQRLLESDSRWVGVLLAEWSDPIARSSVLLLLNTAITGVLGLVYWLIAARLFPQAAVGRAAALVSASILLAGVGQLNLSGMLMRFLPQAGVRSRHLVLVTYAIACAASLLLAVLAGLGVGFLTGPNSPLRLSALDGAIFAASVAATVVFTLQDSVLIAVRRTGWIPIENGGFGVVKIVMLVALAGFSGWGAIFASWMLPLAATLPLITWLLFGWLLPRRTHEQPLPPIRSGTKRQIRSFVYGDASAGVFAQTWTYMLPVIVTGALGAKQNAIFYAAFLFSSTLDQIAVNYSSPLVVEGARDESALPALVKAAIRRIYIVLVPPVLLFTFAGGLVLHAYGPAYAAGATALCLLSLSCLPKALLFVYYGVCRVQRKTHRSAVMQGASCAAILAGALLLSQHGLAAICAVVLSVQVIGALVAAPRLARACATSNEDSLRN